MNNQEQMLRMLTQLTWSENEQTACQASKIMNFEISFDDAMKHSGGFMRAVLSGDRELAMKLADSDNKHALIYADAIDTNMEDMSL